MFNLGLLLRVAVVVAELVSRPGRAPRCARCQLALRSDSNRDRVQHGL
jgi:hypothetical protein